MSNTYLTTEELAERIKYNPRTIRNQFKDTIFFERMFITFAPLVNVKFCLSGSVSKKICANLP